MKNFEQKYHLKCNNSLLAMQGHRLVVASSPRKASIFSLKHRKNSASVAYLDRKLIDGQICQGDNFYFAVKNSELYINTRSGHERVYYCSETKKLTFFEQRRPPIDTPINVCEVSETDASGPWTKVSGPWTKVSREAMPPEATSSPKVKSSPEVTSSPEVKSQLVALPEPSPQKVKSPETEASSKSKSSSKSSESKLSSSLTGYYINVWSLDSVIRAPGRSTSNQGYQRATCLSQNDPVLDQIVWNEIDLSRIDETVTLTQFKLMECHMIAKLAMLVLSYVKTMTRTPGGLQAAVLIDPSRMRLYYRLPAGCLTEKTWRVMLGSYDFYFRISAEKGV